MSVRFPVRPYKSAAATGVRMRGAHIRLAVPAAVLLLAAAVACTDVQDITQPSCTYAISAGETTFTPAGGSGTLTVTAPGVCEWNVAAESAWITFTSPTSGTGNGTVGFTVSANPASAPRSGTVAVGGQTLEITQSAAACDLTVAPGSIAVGADGDSARITVTGPGACPWSASSNRDWIEIAGGAEGTGSGRVDIAIHPNPSTTGRSGTLSVAGRGVTIAQSGRGCSFAVAPTSASFGPGGGTASIDVSTGSGCSWTARSEDSWIAITGDGSGAGSGRVSYAVDPNPGASTRTGRLSVAGRTVLVTQAGSAPAACEFVVAPTAASYTPAGGSGTIGVLTSSGCSWTATSTASWISITGEDSGTGSGPVAYAVAANASPAARTGTLQIAGQTVTITQTAAVALCTYTLDPSSQSVSASSGSGDIEVDTQAGCAWTAVSSAAWLTIDSGDASGTGDADIDFSVSRNPSQNSRTATITVGDQVATVTQQGQRDDDDDD